MLLRDERSDDGHVVGQTSERAVLLSESMTPIEVLELEPVAREDGVHTAGSSSQISDGAAALLMMTAEKAAELGLTPRARVVDTCLVGVDPVLMLTGPIDATQRLLGRTGVRVSPLFRCCSHCKKAVRQGLPGGPTRMLF